MRKIWILWLLYPGLAIAQDLPAVSVLPDQIQVLLGKQVLDLDEPSSYAYIVEKDPAGGKKLIQIYFKTTKTSEGVTLKELRCTSPGGRMALDIAKGAAACGIAPLAPPQSRDVTVFLASVTAQNSAQPRDITATGTYSLALAGPLGFKTIAGNKEVFIGGLQKKLKAKLRDDLKRSQSDLQVKLRFSPADDAPAYTLHVADVGDNRAGEPVAKDEAGDYIKISLSDFLPSRPQPYKLIFSIDKTKLSPDIQQQIDPGDKDLAIAVRMPGETTPDRDHANFFLDVTYTSYVNPFNPARALSASNNGQRRNVGLFELTYKPGVRLKTWGLDGKGRLQWLAVNPYLTADISTLPLREARVPTQIADGADLEYGVEIRRQPLGLRGLIFTAGPRHESDRDFKFQTAAARMAATPLFGWLIQNRAFRSRVAANRRRSPFVTAYSFRPTAGYEIGDVIRDRPQRLTDNVDFQDYISRFLIDFSMAIELKRYLTLSASDSYYYHWQVQRRPNRNYVEAKVEYNTGYLFRRHGARGLQHSIEAKFQRGEQAPAFEPVNVFSIGMSFVR